MNRDVRKRKGILLNLNLNKQTAIHIGLLFFTARANIGGMIPFGLPACCAWLFSEECTKWPLNRLLYIAALIAGSFSLGHWTEAGVVTCGILLFALSASLLTHQEKNSKLGVLLLVCVFVPTTIFLVGTDASFGDLLRFLIQMVIMFVSFYLYGYVRNGLQARKNAAILTQDQFASICIAVVIVLMGFPDMRVAGLSTMHIIAICIILLVAWAGGFGVGAACGTVAGMLMASGNSIYMCMYALGGFMAGLLNRFRKLGTILGFVIANILLACVAGGAKELILGMYETGFAVVAFLLVPQKPVGIFDVPMLRKILARAEPETASADQETAPLLGENYIPTGLMIGLAAGKVSDLSRIGDEIAKQTETLFDNGTDIGAGSQEQWVMQIYSRVCARCAMRESCWNTAYAQTYKMIHHLAVCTDQSDEEGVYQTIAGFLQFCPNTEKLQGECKKITALLRLEQIWRGRNRDCRKATAWGLAGVSRMMRRAGDELDEQRKIYYELRDRVRRGLEQGDLTLVDFACRFTRSGHLEVRLAMPRSSWLPCSMHAEAGHCENCSRAAGILSKITGRNIVAGELCACQENICTVAFCEKPVYETEFGVVSAKAYKSVQSGDCFTKFQLEEGGVYAVLSDGLGTGELASRQSNACLRLIRLFLEGGLNFGEASEAVDLLIAASGDGETVSTAVDALYIDLYEGMVHFAKRGAAPSYLLDGQGGCREITMSQAPLGFLAGGGQPVREKIAHGYVVVLLSDGVSDAFGAGKEDLSEFLVSLIGEGGVLQKMAGKILHKAIALSAGKPKDDMTVVAIRVLER